MLGVLPWISIPHSRGFETRNLRLRRDLASLREFLNGGQGQLAGQAQLAKILAGSAHGLFIGPGASRLQEPR